MEKGNKERKAYFDAKTKRHLQKYVEGRKDDVSNVYPHKFRRTMAIDKGMPIEQVQQLLGHQQINTTLHYAMVNPSNVKILHQKYIS